MQIIVSYQSQYTACSRLDLLKPRHPHPDLLRTTPLPWRRYPRRVVDSLDSRAYIGQFSADGQFFVAAFQARGV